MGNKYAVKKKKLFEEVINLIEMLLQSGDYKVGDRLPSLSELSNLFEVGKPTIREALSVLTSTGVLEVRQGSGIYVNRLTLKPHANLFQDGVSLEQELINWLEFRKVIEAEAAELAAVRHTEEDIKTLEYIQEQLERELELGGVASELDYQFHLTIVKLTGNPFFVDGITSNSHILQQDTFERIRQGINIESRKELIITEHRKIISAIKRRKSEEARQVMLKHIDNAAWKVKIIGGGRNQD